jgi:hypothetical protein
MASAQTECPCVAPENGSGTATLIPTTCQVGYLGFMQIEAGLPAGDTIDCQAELHSFFNVTEVPGGSLGGHTQAWNATLTLTMSGTGSLGGFNRIVHVPVAGTSESAPRTFGSAVQSFTHNLTSLTGQLFGDPDFCTMQVNAGTAATLPASPGSSTLTRLGPPGADWQFDSFFDITYKITFQGCPGSLLEGYNGTTQKTHRFQVCTQPPVAVAEDTWTNIKRLFQ